jgi:hypothetical protein
VNQWGPGGNPYEPQPITDQYRADALQFSMDHPEYMAWARGENK